MRWRVALMHPFGLTLLLASVLLAAVVLLKAPWSGRGIWLFVWGILAYGASAAVVLLRSRPIPDPSPPIQDKVALSQTKDLVPLTEEALRKLRRLPDLGKCALIAHLSHTLNSNRTAADGQSPAQATPLEQAQALRQVLVDAIQKLKPPQGDEAGTAQSHQYYILHEEYVVGRPNNAIMTRLSISEGTFHRRRRRGAPPRRRRDAAADAGRRVRPCTWCGRPAPDRRAA